MNHREEPVKKHKRSTRVKAPAGATRATSFADTWLNSAPVDFVTRSGITSRERRKLYDLDLSDVQCGLSVDHSRKPGKPGKLSKESKKVKRSIDSTTFLKRRRLVRRPSLLRPEDSTAHSLQPLPLDFPWTCAVPYEEKEEEEEEEKEKEEKEKEDEKGTASARGPGLSDDARVQALISSNPAFLERSHLDGNLVSAEIEPKPGTKQKTKIKTKTEADADAEMNKKMFDRSPHFHRNVLMFPDPLRDPLGLHAPTFLPSLAVYGAPVHYPTLRRFSPAASGPWNQAGYANKLSRSTYSRFNKRRSSHSSSTDYPAYQFRESRSVSQDGYFGDTHLRTSSSSQNTELLPVTGFFDVCSLAMKCADFVQDKLLHSDVKKERTFGNQSERFDRVKNKSALSVTEEPHREGKDRVGLDGVAGSKAKRSKYGQQPWNPFSDEWVSLQVIIPVLAQY